MEYVIVTYRMPNGNKYKKQILFSLFEEFCNQLTANNCELISVQGVKVGEE